MWAASLSTESNFRCLVQICQSYRLHTCIISPHRDRAVCRVTDSTIHFHTNKTINAIQLKNIYLTSSCLLLLFICLFIIFMGKTCLLSKTFVKEKLKTLKKFPLNLLMLKVECVSTQHNFVIPICVYCYCRFCFALFNCLFIFMEAWWHSD